jgi:hypothetical protein
MSEDREVDRLIAEIDALAEHAGRRFERDEDKVAVFAAALEQGRIRARDAVALGMARDRD